MQRHWRCASGTPSKQSVGVDYTEFTGSTSLEDLASIEVETFLAHGISASVYKAAWEGMPVAVSLVVRVRRRGVRECGSGRGCIRLSSP